MAAKIKKGDQVVVLTGKDKGRKGAVLKVLPTEGRVVVQGVNVVQRYTRPSRANPQGGIVTKEATIHVSNVAHVDSTKRGCECWRTDCGAAADETSRNEAAMLRMVLTSTLQLA